jgi:hypothetical protein
MGYSVRDHLRHTNRLVTGYQRYTGTTVLWWEWDQADTTVDTLYDEGSATGHRRWYPPKKIPVYSLIRTDRTERPGSEGFYDAASVHVSALLDQLRKAGLTNPADSQKHLFDRFLYAGMIFEIRTYQIHGRLQSYETDVGIDATQVNPEELINDPDFGAYLS